MNNGNQPRVSIITAVYNCSTHIEEMINSVINQTYINWELIIVDDHSDDATVEIILNYLKKDNRIVIIKNKSNIGSGLSRNKAIKLAVGKYIAFLDGDDIWAKNKLEIQISLMEKNNWAFSHTSFGYLSESGKKIKDTFHVSKNPVGYYDLLKKTEIGCLTAVYNQKMIGKYYMSHHRRKQDYALWLNILKDEYYSNPIDIELAFYRLTPGSATSKKYKLIIYHFFFLRETQNLSVFTSIYYTLYWVMNGIFKFYIK